MTFCNVSVFSSYLELIHNPTSPYYVLTNFDCYARNILDILWRCLSTPKMNPNSLTRYFVIHTNDATR